MGDPRWLLSLAVAAVLTAGACSTGRAPVPRVYNMGDKVEFGPLTYDVYDAQWLPQIGEGTGARIPQGRFFVIRLGATNGGAAEMIVPTATLEDDSGKLYEELRNGDGVPEWLGFVRRVKGTGALTGMIVFDVPPQHYRLRLTGADPDEAAFVDIPLSFSNSPAGLPPAAPTGLPAPGPGDAQ